MTKNKKSDNYLDLFNPGELLVIKTALLNFRKAPFVSKTELIIIEELLTRINEEN
tara:strand:- start:442 stop:606 length:165 start_codon:yes stop_codon:yes gene_type:complete